MAAAVVFLAAATLWVVVARRSFYYLLPTYVLLCMVRPPFTVPTEVFPDFGLGALVLSVPNAADTMLVATMVASSRARAGMLRPTNLALAGVSLAAVTLGAFHTSLPVATMLFLGLAPLRVALLGSLFSAARDDGPRPQLYSTVLTVGLLAVPSAALLAALVLRRAGSAFPVERLERAGLYAAGRPVFPTLGNNKIGLCLLILLAVLLIERSSWRHRRNDHVVLAVVLVVTVGATAVASLRFATTAVLLVAIAFALGETLRVAGVTLIGASVTFAAVMRQETSVRAFSVISGSFQGLEDSSARSRLAMWRAAVDLWRRDPLFGRIGSWEYERPVTRLVFWRPLETHSEYLWQLASFGVVGVVVLAIALLRTLRVAWHAGFAAVVAMLMVIAGLGFNTAMFFPVACACLGRLLATAAGAPPGEQDAGVPAEREAVSVG